MEHSFNNTDEEKRERVLNSGYKEFAEQGPERASLNTILKNATVSKGFFYHYFKNKEAFLNYLVEQGVQIILDTMDYEKLLEERDFILRIQKSTEYKMKVSNSHPQIFNFYASYLKSLSKEKVIDITEKYSNAFDHKILSDNIDFSLFREDIPVDLSIKVVMRYIQQMSEEFIPIMDTMSYEQLTNIYKKELKDLRKVVYKKGEE